MCVFDIKNKEKLREKPFMQFKGIHQKAVLSSHIGKENKFLITCGEGSSINVFDIEEMIESYAKKLSRDRTNYKHHHDHSQGDGNGHGHGGNPQAIGGDTSRQTTDVQQNSGLGLVGQYCSSGGKPIRQPEEDLMPNRSLGHEPGRRINQGMLTDLPKPVKPANIQDLMKSQKTIRCDGDHSDDDSKDMHDEVAQATKPIYLYEKVNEPGWMDMCISKDNRFLIVASDDKNIKFFDIANMRDLQDVPVLVLQDTLNFVHIMLDSKGRYLYASSKQGVVKVFSMKSCLKQFRSNKTVYSKYYTKFDEFGGSNIAINIGLFNSKKDMNAASFSLISDFLMNWNNEPRQNELKKILMSNKEEIFGKFLEMGRISMFDIQIWTLVFRVLALDRLIGRFITEIMQSTDIIKPGVLVIFEWLLLLFNGRLDDPNPLDENMGTMIMKALISNQLSLLPNFDKGTKELVEKGMVLHPTRQLDIQGENLNESELEAFELTNYNASQLEIEVFAFTDQLDLTNPTQVMGQYFYCIGLYLASELELLSEPKTFVFIDEIWKYYQYLHYRLLLFYCIPLL